MAQIIGPSSVFRRIPVDIPRRQILYLDAIRISAEMADMASGRLHETLFCVTERRNDEAVAKPNGEISSQSPNVVPAMLDAYSVVDSVHRFRELLRGMPGLKHNAPFKLFMRQTDHVKDLRNITQHLDQEVDRIAARGLAALGTLTWIGPSGVANGPPTSWLWQAGTFYAQGLAVGPTIDTWSTLPKGEIAEVSLVTSGYNVNLSAISKSLRSIVRSLERSLEMTAVGKEHFGSDILMAMIIEPVDNDPTTAIDNLDDGK